MGSLPAGGMLGPWGAGASGSRTAEQLALKHSGRPVPALGLLVWGSRIPFEMYKAILVVLGGYMELASRIELGYQ